jgi:hypothetical protein
MTDPINPAHYKGSKMECIDAITAAVEDKRGLEAVCVANVIKYLWRYRDKHPDDPSCDPKKARWYLDRLIELLEAEELDTLVEAIQPRPGEIVPRPTAHGTMD